MFLLSLISQVNVCLQQLYLISPDSILVVGRKAGDTIEWGDALRSKVGHGQRDRWEQVTLQPCILIGRGKGAFSLVVLTIASGCRLYAHNKAICIYREQLVGAIFSKRSLPFQNWNLMLFVVSCVNWKLPQLDYIQRKHGLESRLQFCLPQLI